jgi:hypothetical protein
MGSRWNANTCRIGRPVVWPSAAEAPGGCTASSPASAWRRPAAQRPIYSPGTICAVIEIELHDGEHLETVGGQPPRFYERS